MKKYERRVSWQQKQLMIYLRYGSRTHFHRTVRSISDVAKRLGLPWMTVRNALARFIEAGHRWEDVKMGPKP